MGSARWLVLAVLVVCAPREARAEERVTLRLGTQAIEGTRYMQDIVALSAEIESRTRGDVRLEWVPNGQLGDEAAMVELIGRGKLDGGGFSETGLIAAVPEMAVWRYPGLFRGHDEVDRATAALEPTIRELFARRDLVFAMWADLGFAHVFATEPAANLRELLVLASTWITMPLDGKLFEAVAGGARAWAMPPLYVLAMAKVRARTMSRLPYRYVVGGLVISKAAWSRLSSAQQTQVMEICRVWQPRLRKSWRAESERGIAALAKSGVRIQQPSETELTGFFSASTTSRAAQVSSSEHAELMGTITKAIGSK